MTARQMSREEALAEMNRQPDNNDGQVYIPCPGLYVEMESNYGRADFTVWEPGPRGGAMLVARTPHRKYGDMFAAAPDMLAALRRVAAHWSQHSDPETQGIACDVFAAIAKAEGRTP